MFSRTKTLKESFAVFQQQLSKVYEPKEARSIAQIVFYEVLGYDTIKIILNENELIPASQFEQLDFILHQLLQSKPIQYILSKAIFMDMDFIVNQDVLIPRPETEELVRWIIKDVQNNQNIKSILDIGTGSGCIPISIKKNIPSIHMASIDVSAAALKIAERNATKHQVNIVFMHLDILIDDAPKGFDIIVSNPPYVTQQDKFLMNKNVLDFEPHLALFVPEEQPIMFYERIVEIAHEVLNPQGAIYFEINESLSEEVCNLFNPELWSIPIVKKDFRNKDRFVYAKLNQ